MIIAAARPASAAKPYRPYTAERTSRGLRLTLPMMPAATHHAATTNESRIAMVPTTATGDVGRSRAVSGGTVTSRNPRGARVDSYLIEGRPLVEVLLRLR